MKAATTRLSLLALAMALSACSTSILDGDKIDYKSAAKGSSLEVPPDLTQLSRDSRYAMPGGTFHTLASAGCDVDQEPVGGLCPCQRLG